MPELIRRGAQASPHRQASESAAGRYGRLAIASLYREVALSPKPGLVTPTSNGSHRDMTFATFLRSLQALRGYFPSIAASGTRQATFCELQRLGIAAEADMMRATGGINTHRGAIFNLGLLCAAAGSLHADGDQPDAASVCKRVREAWGDAIIGELIAADGDAPVSHGLHVARRYGAGGARLEAASGFPAALAVGLPAYQTTLGQTGDIVRSEVQALFALIATLEDTNVLWRGGAEGLAHARASAAAFLAAGGVLADDWRDRAGAIEADFNARQLSPGGSADLLGVTLFLAGLDGLA
jgi:triphosphoribosyl-dephospho-CoA synthase